MQSKIDSRFGFEGTNVDNLRSLVEFVLHGITSIKIETLFVGSHTTVPSITKIIGVATIDAVTIMVCVW